MKVAYTSSHQTNGEAPMKTTTKTAATSAARPVSSSRLVLLSTAAIAVVVGAARPAAAQAPDQVFGTAPPAFVPDPNVPPPAPPPAPSAAPPAADLGPPAWDDGAAVDPYDPAFASSDIYRDSLDTEVTYDDSVAAGYDDGYDPQAYTQFQDTLAPYGSWENDSTYGNVWIPSES